MTIAKHPSWVGVSFQTLKHFIISIQLHMVLFHNKDTKENAIHPIGRPLRHSSDSADQYRSDTKLPAMVATVSICEQNKETNTTSATKEKEQLHSF